MKRYLLFAGATYYPFGGWHDLHGSFDTLAEAEAKGEKILKEEYMVADMEVGWFHVVDSTTGIIDVVGGD